MADEKLEVTPGDVLAGRIALRTMLNMTSFSSWIDDDTLADASRAAIKAVFDRRNEGKK